jgi:DNA methyltransferase 1-associated protein 1 (DMAP1)
MLIAELKKIELRKKEREKKTQDLQKLITAADSQLDQSFQAKSSSHGSADRKTSSVKSAKKLSGAAQKSHQKAMGEAVNKAMVRYVFIFKSSIA